MGSLAPFVSSILLSRLCTRASPFARSAHPSFSTPLSLFCPSLRPLYSTSLSLNSVLAPRARFFTLSANNNKMDSDASMFSLGEESDGYVPETVSILLFYPSFVKTITRFAHCMPVYLLLFACSACQTASQSFNPSLQAYSHQATFLPNTFVSALPSQT
jgi:hypothetical protein